MKNVRHITNVTASSGSAARSRSLHVADGMEDAANGGRAGRLAYGPEETPVPVAGGIVPLLERKVKA